MGWSRRLEPIVASANTNPNLKYGFWSAGRVSDQEGLCEVSIEAEGRTESPLLQRLRYDHEFFVYIML